MCVTCGAKLTPVIIIHYLALQVCKTVKSRGGSSEIAKMYPLISRDMGNLILDKRSKHMRDVGGKKPVI